MGDKSPKATQKKDQQKNKKTDAAKQQKSAASAPQALPKTGKN